MKMKFGAIVVDGRGKIGGHVASKNRSCAYLRTKVTPVNPQTGYQLGVRNRFTGFSQGWSALTQAQRDAWNSAVADFAKTNIFGDLVNPSGFNLFQRLNNNLDICGVAQNDTPPAPESVGVIVTSSLTADAAPEALSLVLDANVPADTYGIVYATAGQSPGKAFVKAQFRIVKVLAPAAATPVDLLADYKTKYGALPGVGMKIFVRVKAINANTGQAGTPSEVSTIVIA